VALYNWLRINGMMLQSDKEALRKERGLDDDMTEFEVPAAIPTQVEMLKRSLTQEPRDPLERQRAQSKVDFEARRLRRQ
jgi:hypothetical protein